VVERRRSNVAVKRVNVLVLAIFAALATPLAAAAAIDTSTDPDRSVPALLLAAAILIVATAITAFFGTRRILLTEKEVGVDFSAGTNLTQEEWERITQQQREGWKKDIDYREEETPATNTYTPLTDLKQSEETALAAGTPLSEEEWDKIPEPSRQAWAEDTDYRVDTTDGVKTFTPMQELTVVKETVVAAADAPLSEDEWNVLPETLRSGLVPGTDYNRTTTPAETTYTALNNLSAKLLLTPGVEIPNAVWSELSRSEGAGLKRGTDFRVQRGHWFRKLVVGADNRWSTSKSQALFWTYAVVFGLSALIFAKWMGNPQGWNTLVDMDTDDWDVYLILLGGPFAALVLAKLTTSTKTDNGTIDKTVAPTSTLDPLKGLGQLVADDAGQPDLGDTQYFVFNLVAIMFFLGTIVGNLQHGFPALPAFLVGLTSVSAATYIGKKAAARAQPTLKSVVPRTQDVGETVDIWGSYLVVPAPTLPPPPEWRPRATVGGIEAPDVIVIPDAGPTDHLRLTVPTRANGSAPIVVYTATGSATAPLEFMAVAKSSNETSEA